MGPLWREIPAYRAYFRLSPRVPVKGAPSIFCNRVHMDRATTSPEPLVYLFIYSLIHSLIHACLQESPKRSPHTYGEKRKVAVHGVRRRRKACIQWGAAWFPKGVELVLLYVKKLASVGILLNSVVTFSTTVTLNYKWHI